MGFFGKSSSNGVSTAVQSCQAGKGVLVVMVTRTDTGKPVNGVTANITGGPTAGSATSNKLGAAIFNSRDPGAYDVGVPLVGALAGYRVVSQTLSGGVTAGRTQILTLDVAPEGRLQVNVVNPKKLPLSEHFDIAIAGPEAASQVVNPASGHAFGPVLAGKYTVSVTARGGHYEKRIVSVSEVVVPPGGTGTATLMFTPLLNMVTPVIEMEYRVVLLDPKLSVHQAGGEVLIEADEVTRIELSVQQTLPAVGWDGKALFIVSPNHVEVYIDALCTQRYVGKITNVQLLPGPLPLYLKSKTAGLFKARLELDPPVTAALIPFVEIKPAAVEDMGVVELKMKLHQHDLPTIDGLAVNPDVAPRTKYYKALKDLELPDQIELTDTQKVADGRLLHLQNVQHHGRAKLLIERLDAGQWPGGTDDHQISLTMVGGGGGLSLFDKEHKGQPLGTAAPLKHVMRVKDLKAKAVECWVEGSTESTAMRDRVLSLGLDRPSGGAKLTAAHAPKQKGNFARFTVIKVQAVEFVAPVGVAADPWDAADKRFFINYQDDTLAGTHDNRKVRIKARLSQPLPDIHLFFMLAPHEDNTKKANWGVDKPWKWKDVDPGLKHVDKPDRMKLLHHTVVTDAAGEAITEALRLSRFGGDKFTPCVYIDQDPQLAKYMPADADLKKREPPKAADAIEVWRKIWYQRIKVAGQACDEFDTAAAQYTSCKMTLEKAADIDIPLATAQGFTGTADYPKYMFKVGGAGSSTVVTERNKGQFLAGFVAEADKPLKTPIIVCDVYTDDDGSTASRNVGWTERADFPATVRFDKAVVMPAVQAGDVVAGGTWESVRWDGANYVDPQNGPVTDAHLTIEATRDSLGKVDVDVLAAVPADATHVRIVGLTLQAPETGLLGGFDRSDQRTVVVYDPNEPVDFQNTVAHEIGHSLFLARKTLPGIPVDHPEWYWESGNHCKYKKNKCVMYESGPIAGSLNAFCPTCHPYVLANNMFRLKGNADARDNVA